MEYFKKVETMVIWSFIVLLALMYGILSNKSDTPTASIQNTPVENTQEEVVQYVPTTSEVEYNGEDGRTALNLLKAKYRVEVQSFGELGEFVKSIDGVEPDSTHFWAFYVNGSIAQEGAQTYVTKSSDTVEWKIEKIQ